MFPVVFLSFVFASGVWFFLMATRARHPLPSRIFWSVIGAAALIFLQGTPQFFFQSTLREALRQNADQDVILTVLTVSLGIVLVVGFGLYLFLRRTKAWPAAIVGLVSTALCYLVLYVGYRSHR